MRTVNLADDRTVDVYPVGMRHLTELGRFVQRAYKSLSQEGVELQLGDTAMLLELGTGVLQRDLVPMVGACCEGPEGWSLAEADLTDGILIIEAWIEETFGTPKKAQALIRALENLVSKVVGREVRLGTILSDLQSVIASDGDTTGETSSTTDSQDTPTADGN